MALDFNDAGRSPFEDANLRKARVEKALQARIREFVRYLYPRAAFSARDARIGDPSGVSGESMSISITPDQSAGRWIDHATGDKGDVFTLYARAHALDPRSDFAKILAECDAWAGGAPSERAETRRKAEAEKPAEPEPPKNNKRPRVLEEAYIYRTREGQEWGFEQRRYRYTDAEGGKTYRPFWRGQPGMPPEGRPLYNLNRWHSEPAVVVVEGEKCADALTSIGVHATTLMGGAQTTITKTDLTPLAGKDITLWPDNDAPGRTLMDNLAGPLRAMGCRVRVLAIPAGKPEKWDVADAIAEGFDVLAFLRGEASQEPPKPRLPILDVDGLLNVPDPTWIVSGWIIDDGASVFYGPPKTFKTFNVLDLALSVACGNTWRGNPTVQRPVLYLLGEGMGTFKHRVHVWLQKRSEGRPAQFWTVPVGVPLSTPEGLSAALEAVQSLPVMPGLIVVDTLNRHFGPGDENSSQDMTRFVQAIDALRAATRAHILIVHHSGKDADKGARGSSALLGAVDNEFRITRTEGTRLCRIECTAARHSDEPKPMTVELVKFDGVHPTTGEVISSLLPVLRDVEAEDQDAPGPIQNIIALLRAGPKTSKEIAEELSISPSWVREILPQLRKQGKVYSSQVGKAFVWHVPAGTPADEHEQ